MRPSCFASSSTLIARLNVGGPAIQAITLSRLLEERGYQTRLIRGREGAREGSMDALAEQLGDMEHAMRWINDVVTAADLRRDPSARTMTMQSFIPISICEVQGRYTGQTSLG